MPLQATSGAASYDAFGGGVPVEPNYIESVFSTFLYTGNGSTQTITNGIDLAGKGGLVWLKDRSQAFDNGLFDTARGAGYRLISNSTAAENFSLNYISSFNSNGFSLGAPSSSTNTNGDNYASWTFREQPKFFDVVTWTGNGTTQAIAHNLGSVPGFIVIKRTDSADDWWCFHRYDFTQRFKLNATNAAVNTNNQTYLGDNSTAVSPTSTTFTIGNTSGLNASGGTFVAYVFAHNAGGFGLTGTDNVISCGSFTSSSIGLATVDLEYEPQWILYKGSNGVTNWQLVDNMRGFVVGAANSGTSFLNANTSAAEGTNPPVGITNTGFNFDGAANITYIYIAIRRGPMRTPTTGTSVFSVAPNLNANPEFTSGFPVDAALMRRVTTTAENYFASRLTGTGYMFTESTSAEQTSSSFQWDYQNGWLENFYTGTSGVFSWNFRRAPGFFDAVCYTGTGVARTVSHNLTVVPEMMIVKRRDAAGAWGVYTAATGASALLQLESSAAVSNGAPQWNDTAPTSSVFSLAAVSSTVNTSGGTYVWYGFATCPGVSKVGSYTGTGTTQTINCGFTAGSRFVLIKRTDSTGDWYVWDSARGIVSGNDPYLLLNSTAAEVTNTDFIDTASTGFEISSTAPAAINASGGSFIFLAIA